MNIPWYIYPSSWWWILAFFQFGAIFDKAAMYAFEYVFQWAYALILLSMFLGVGLLGHKRGVCLAFRDTS